MRTDEVSRPLAVRKGFKLDSAYAGKSSNMSSRNKGCQTDQPTKFLLDEEATYLLRPTPEDLLFYGFAPLVARTGFVA